MRRFKSVLALVLTLVMILSCTLPANAVGSAETSVHFEKVSNDEIQSSIADRLVNVKEEPEYRDSDIVRVSIVLESESTIKRGFSAINIAENSSAMAYRSELQAEQEALTAKISDEVLGGDELDVVWNLTLAVNEISANVPYGEIEDIKAVDGVKDVVIQTRYEPDVVSVSEADPNMSTSSDMIGSSPAWAAGYTGAGSKIAVIDTGTDTDHQSFDAGAFEYAIEQTGKNVTLMTVADIERVFDELNIASISGVTADQLYLNAKLPFAYNYVDEDYDITHDHDEQGEHGSHVAGIATANRYIPDGEGGYVDALDTVFTQGVAPDAQLITMKVFGKGGGAYDADYMAAIEDAILLGCDSINLSLGSGNPGMSTNSKYQDILDSLTEAGAVVCISAGNSGTWQEQTYYGYLYNDDASMSMTGSPGTYTNSLSVASVDNVGGTGYVLKVGDLSVPYSETSGYTNASILTLDGSGEGTEYDFILFESTIVDGSGNNLLADYDELAEGKIVMGYRGTSSFYEKHMAVEELGGAAFVLVNNTTGTINMDLSSSTATIPAVSITQASGEEIKAVATKVEDPNGMIYYTGKITVKSTVEVTMGSSEYYTMSSFSSWGIPGSLEMKPEITAPGGNIYSVNGAVAGGKAYENMSGTSMASPQVAGMMAVLAQYIRENDLAAKTGMSQRQLAQSLIMSTATPIVEEASGYYYSILNQGTGLANVNDAINAHSYITMADGANAGAADGKVKVELGDDPAKNGVYTFGYTLHNLTDAAASYFFRTDVFTQEAWSYGSGEDQLSFLDTYTVALDGAVVTYAVNGEPISQSGLTSVDAQNILDYCAGICELTEEELERYDVDGDGKVTTHDAHLILYVQVPVDGSVDVTVTIDVTGCDFSAYPNGAYIEAYSYATEFSSDEGEEGTVHSIPVLGFYGNWSDPSMYDVGSLPEYWYETESRYPYLVMEHELFTNYLTIKYGGSGNEYYFFGNPLADDDEYLVERNAFNSNDVLSKYYTTIIRNAGGAIWQVTDSETGKLYARQELGAASSAYYYANGAKWQNTQSTVTLNWAGTDMEGEKLPEGTSFDVSLVLAPEYYASADGTYDWDKLTAGVLGEGAYLTTHATIDNTAPEMTALVYDADAKTYTATVAENRYLATIALYQRGVERELDYVAPNQPLESVGETADYVLDVSALEDGAELYIQVTDYAMNQSTYKLVLGSDNEKVNPTSVTISPETLKIVKGTSATLTASYEPWLAKDETVWSVADSSVATVSQTGVVTGVAVGTTTVTATSAHDESVSATCAVEVVSFDVTLTGALQDKDGNPILFTWDMENDSTWTKTNDIENYLNAATLDILHENGPMYQMDPSGYLYQVDTATGETLSKSAGTADFGAPVDDMEYAAINSLRLNQDILAGVYGPYVIYSAPAMANTFSNGWNMATYLGNYLQASSFTAIAWAGYTTNSQGKQVDVFCCLTDTGDFWIMSPDFQSGSAGLNFFYTDLDLDFPGYDGSCYCSMVMGDDGNFYLSYFNGSTNEIYVLEAEDIYEGGEYVDTAYHALLIGDVGDGVWPCSLLSVSANETSTDADPATVETLMRGSFEVTVQAESIRLPEKKTASGGLNVVSTNGNEKQHTLKKLTAEETGRVYLDVNAEDSTNGLVTMTYDPAVLEFEEVKTYGNALTAWTDVDGTVTFAYADAAALNGKVATAVFSYVKNDANESTSITVTTKEDGSDFTEESSVVELVTNGHKHSYTSVVTDATCTAAGYTTYTCACGHSYIDSMVPATGHDYSTEVTAPTCDMMGYTTHTCDTCGDSYIDTFVPATDHDFEQSVTKVATCTQEGELTFTCKDQNCGVSYTMIVPKADHTDSAVVTAPTCTAAGYTTHTCSVCGYSYIDTMVSATGHSYDSVVTAPTCTAAGYTTHTCSVCNDSYVNSIVAATGHNYTPEVTKPTCTAGGYTTYTCACGASYVADKTPAAGHSYTGVVTKPTCTAGGYTTYVCGNCDSSYIGDNVPANGHDFIHGVVAPTCIAAGYTTHTCNTCGYDYRDTATEPVGHQYGEWNITKEATQLTAGSKTHICGICGKDETVEIPATGAGPCYYKSFSDCEAAWYHEAVDFVVAENLMAGMGEHTFVPNGAMNRAMMVTVLYRMAGTPAVDSLESFKDVETDRYFSAAIAWAKENGIVAGITEDTFQPMSNVTREQIASILWRYVGKPDATADFRDVSDADSISAYAVDAMTWAYASGIFSGDENGNLRPTDNATRAEFASIIMRFLGGSYVCR